MHTARRDPTLVDPPALPDLPDAIQPGVHVESEPEDLPYMEMDFTDLWAEVLRARQPLNVPDRTMSTLDGTNNAGSFQSIDESQKTSEGDSDDGEIVMVYEHGPGVLSPGAKQQERYRVDAAKNGK